MDDFDYLGEHNLRVFAERVGTTASSSVQIMVSYQVGGQLSADNEPRLRLEPVNVLLEQANVDVTDIDNQTEYVCRLTGLDLGTLVIKPARDAWRLFVDSEHNKWGLAVYSPERLAVVAELCALPS